METSPGLARGDGVRRDVVSFVRRSARMRPNQRLAWEDHHEDLVISVARAETSTSVHPNARIDLTAAFGRDAPLVVEIGPGTGESLIPMAAARPDANVLAFEVYQPAIAQLLVQVVGRGLDNVRIVEADAAAGLRHLLPERVIDEVWTFFPDPWPKAKHHKRRLISSRFVDLVAERLVDGGVWHLATDWEDYALAMRDVLDAQPGLVCDHPQDWAPRWDARPVTRFERRGLTAGRSVFDLSYSRVPRGV